MTKLPFLQLIIMSSCFAFEILSMKVFHSSRNFFPYINKTHISCIWLKSQGHEMSSCPCTLEETWQVAPPRWSRFSFVANLNRYLPSGAQTLSRHIILKFFIKGRAPIWYWGDKLPIKNSPTPEGCQGVFDSQNHLPKTLFLVSCSPLLRKKEQVNKSSTP